ncbi:MAG TPA: ATP-grasp domain-containing protein [Candidatus Paceibacterota bacterium]|nr:ATP-grasp domain-containing protein [Candidatus Paceibacterota bacterium]
MRTVVGVLRGGPSSEYEVSLKSGASILQSLDREKYEPRDLFIDRSGQWHAAGAPVTPERALRGVDVAFNVIHGEYGEDGRLHDVLDSLGVPYTGANAEASMLAFDKARTKQALKKLGIRTPRVLLVTQDDAQGGYEKLALDIFRSFPHPAIVKPAIGGSSVGITVVNTFHTLAFALEKAFAVSPRVLIEEYIKGREATVGVIDDFRGEKTYALMPIEIIPPPSRPFFDYDAKYGGETVERVPGNFTAGEKEELAAIARAAHEALGQAHYSRSDFVVSRRGIFFLETNSASAVGMTRESLFPKALSAIGASLGHFTDHVVTLAQGGRRVVHTRHG